jgi:hypothetical protein
MVNAACRCLDSHLTDLEDKHLLCLIDVAQHGSCFIESNVMMATHVLNV